MNSQAAGILLKQAIDHHIGENLKAAEAIYRQILADDPNHPDALHLLGVILIQSSLHDDGAELIRRAIALRGAYPEASQNLASLTGGSVMAKVRCENAVIESMPQHWVGVEDNTIGWWARRQLFDFAHCFAGTQSSWLTIGDTYGHDSIDLRTCGIDRVVASSMNADLLKVGQQEGRIGEYLTLNAEDLSLPDNSFDFILCKEALHHMPRPMAAIYEMLRVARQGVFFIEPQDTIIDLPRHKESIYWHHVDGNLLTSGRIGSDDVVFQSSVDWVELGPGNYVYTLSIREMRKICYGMGLPAFGWKNSNVYFDESIGSEPASLENSTMVNFLEQINLRDQLCALGGMPYIYIVGVLFKSFPSPVLTDALSGRGFSLTRTPTRALALRWPNPNPEASSGDGAL